MNKAQIVEALKALDDEEDVRDIRAAADTKLIELAGADPQPALETAHDALRAWAGDDPEKKLYADEVNDIRRRVAADIAVS